MLSRFSSFDIIFRPIVLLSSVGLLLAGCTSYIPPPATPEKVVPELPIRPPPPVEGKGQLLIDTTWAALGGTVGELAHQVHPTWQRVKPPIPVLVDVREAPAVGAEPVARVRLQHQLRELNSRVPAKARHAARICQPIPLGPFFVGLVGRCS